jgi:hypothetical protein
MAVEAVAPSAYWGSIETRWWISDDGTHRVRVVLEFVMDEEWADHTAVFVGQTSGDGVGLELESLGVGGRRCGSRGRR